MLRNCSKLMLPAPSCQSGFGGADHQLVERKTPMMMIILNAITNHRQRHQNGEKPIMIIVDAITNQNGEEYRVVTQVSANAEL